MTKKVTYQIFQRLYYLISILATWLIFHASYDDKYENEIEYYHADESSFMCHCKIEPFKRDSSLEGPENFQGENGGGGFNPPGGSY